MDYTQRPDYARVVDITTRAALREMVAAGPRRRRHADHRRPAPRLRGRGRHADGRHDRRRPAGHRPEQRRRRLGQRQEVHRVGPPQGRRTATSSARRPTPTPRRSSATRSAIRSRTPPARRCTCWSSCWPRSPWCWRRCSSANQRPSARPGAARTPRLRPADEPAVPGRLEVAMDGLIQALIMGIVQGLTEFLPISSSGHLIIVPRSARLERSVHQLARVQRDAPHGHAARAAGLLLARLAGARAGRPRLDPRPLASAATRIAGWPGCSSSRRSRP